MRRICAIADVPTTGCMEFALLSGGEADCFLVYHNGSVRAYRNRCPHTGAPLNWQPDVFLDYKRETIQCDLHGAQFRIDDGACLYGPCRGEGLQPVAVIIKDEEVWLCDEDVPQV